MDTAASAHGRAYPALTWWVRAALITVFVLAVLDWAGWASGVEALTRGRGAWPQMPPWTAALLATLGAGITLQLGRPSPARIRLGRAAATLAAVLAAVFLAEYATGRSFGLDQLLFAEAVRGLPDDFPGRRPSPRALTSVLLLSLAVGLLRVDRRWARVLWSVALAAAVVMPIVTVFATVFADPSLKGGQANLATLGVALLAVAAILTRPDRNPLAWLLARPDRWPLAQLLGIFASLPIVVELSRLLFSAVGLRGDAVWVLSIALSTIVIGAGAFYIGQREQRLLYDKEQQTSRRAEVDRERFEGVLSHAPSAISVRDREHRYILVNGAFCQLFGQRSVEDVIGRAEDEILPPDVVRDSRRAEDRILAGENFFEEEFIRRGSEGISVMTQRFALRDSGGEVTEMVTIRTDITHRKKALQEIADRVEWEQTIGAAIGEGRLLVYSQPIVDVATRAKVGEELLVRLQDIDSGQVLAPIAFLPQCERHHLMPTIDRFMIGQAIELARKGRCVNVNIDGQTIADDAALREILDALTRAGPAVAGKIACEITETTAIASTEMAKAFARAITDRGCRVVLDDFGTGYGSFTELRHLTLNSLKIDKGFVQKMLEDRDDERVVETIIVVARAYDLSVVAEGVESEEALSRLAELGADRAQGYLFGKPQPVTW